MSCTPYNLACGVFLGRLISFVRCYFGSSTGAPVIEQFKSTSEHSAHEPCTVVVLYLLGVCCACRFRTAEAMGPRPRPTTSSAAAATEEQREPLLTRTSTTTEGSGAAAASASAGTEPTEPERLYPQMIYVTPAGTQYHIDGNCTGMARAKSIQTRYACLACIPAVDGDGTRHRSR